MKTDVRERARNALRMEIAEAATDIFSADGFEKVSVEELAPRIGISRATFFRYFACKEDVVLATLLPFSIDLTAKPGRLANDAHSGVWGHVHQAIEPVIVAVEADPDRAKQRVGLVMRTPALQSRLAARRRVNEDNLASSLEPESGDRLEATVYAGLALTCLDIAWREWVNGVGEERFGDVVHAVFGKLSM